MKKSKRKNKAPARFEAKPIAPGLAARLKAAELLDGVMRLKKTITEQVDADPMRDLAPSERARAQSLALLVLRHRDPLDTVLGQFLDRMPQLSVSNALRIAAAEMIIEDVPPHAAVDAAVRAVRHSQNTRHLAGMTNAVGRRVSEAGKEIWAELSPQELPDWIANSLRKTLPVDVIAAIELAHANGAPLDLTLKDPSGTAEFVNVLDAEWLPTGSLRLREPGQISNLPGYVDGHWWVQDAAAAIPASLFGNLKGKRALDLCAAPGGKTMQLAAAGAEVTALDLSSKRLKQVAENLIRTELNAELVTADALKWQPETLFDAILLDAPCSATGTIRRHPELPQIRDGSELKRLVALQADLLDRSVEMLKPGGQLVYCTCSLLDAEGPRQVTRFLERHSEMAQIKPESEGLNPEWYDKKDGLILRPDYWPELGGMDGFYAALLVKK